MKYMEEIQAAFGKEHCIERGKTYQDVLDLYRGNEIVKLMNVQFILHLKEKGL